jgi:DNA-binding CsgD family transcriptional regulator
MADSFAALRMTHSVQQRWLCNYAQGLGHAGRAEEGIVIMEPYLEAAEAFGEASGIGQAHLVLGRLKRGPEAIAHFEQAVAVLDPSPFGYFKRWSRFELGAALRRDGRRVEAREQLTLALADAERNGEVLVIARAREELKLSGARLRRTAVSGAESLTPAEARIARLAAGGKSNKEIAAELFLTVGTVKMTLVKVFRKLDVTARTDLAEALGAGRALGGAE